MNRTKLSACCIVTVESHPIAAIRAVVAMKDIPAAQRSIRGKIADARPMLNAGTIGRSCTLWRPLGDGRLDLEPGLLVARAFTLVGEVMPSSLPAGRAAHLVMTGSFEGLPGAWEALFAWCESEKHALAKVNWEIYGDTPEDPSKQETSIYALLA